MGSAAPLLTRKAVLLADIEDTYNSEKSLSTDDGFLVQDPDYQVEPNLLQRNFARASLSALPHVVGRKLARMTFTTELRGNGIQDSGDADDAPIITRLFRGCGYSMTAMPAPEMLGVFDIGDHANKVTWAESTSEAATGTLTAASNPSNNDTVTIGSRTYTFKTSLTPTANEVLIGVDASASLDNLIAAINGAAGAGTTYASGTTAHANVTAAAGTGDTMDVTAKVAGTAGNAIATTETGTNLSWGSATLTGGVNVATNTDVIAYYLEVTTGGASGVAQITVTSDTSGEGNAAATVTSGSPFTVGTEGLTITPTFTGNLTQGDRWVLWLLPTGLRLDPVSDDFESLTLKMFFDGMSHTLTGAFGTFTFNGEAGAYGTVQWEFTGQYVAPEDETLPTPVHETTLPVMIELARLRLDDYAAVVNAVSFTQANDIQPRPDVNSSDGYNGVRIVARAPTCGVDPEAALVATHDFWTRMATGQRMPFQMRVGQTAGNRVWMFMPVTQYTGLTYRDRSGLRTYDAGLTVAQYTGDDEVVFAFV
jgi:hypothetical protein